MGYVARRRRRSEIELVVETGANDVLGERNAAGNDATRNRAGLVAKIDVEVLAFSAPVLRQGHFDAGAESPANSGGAAVGRRLRRRKPGDWRARGAARGIKQYAVERLAAAGTQCGEPIAPARGAALFRPIAIGLDAEHEMTPLEIGADRTPDLKPVHAEGAYRK